MGRKKAVKSEIPYSPLSPPAGTPEKAVTDLLVPSGREGSHPGSLKRGYGIHYDEVDGHSTDVFGRPVPTITQEETVAARAARLCPAPDCKEHPVKCFFACQRHWFMVPPVIRSEIWVKSRPNPDMKKLKKSVREAVYWLHFALGPSITPERIATRTIELLPVAFTCYTDVLTWSEEQIREAVRRACEDGEAVAHAPHAEETFQRTWKERLQYVWY